MPPENAVNITEPEWKSRVLSRFGYYSSLIDVTYVMLYFAGIWAVSTYIIPYLPTIEAKMFWYILITLFFVSGLEKLFKLMTPTSSYQTIIIRKD